MSDMIGTNISFANVLSRCREGQSSLLKAMSRSKR